jgi:23S rRNA (pseudouridine1915-N3)-methyltransferase
MRARVVAAGTRLPRWVNEGYAEYADRLTGELRLELREVPVTQRHGPDITRARAEEGKRMLAAVDSGMYVVALEVGGKPHSTESLARWLAARRQDGRDLAFLVGGPDGIDPACAQRADTTWSLSALTLPHGLARVVLAEALYRAFTVLKGHPYHRAGSPAGS